MFHISPIHTVTSWPMAASLGGCACDLAFPALVYEEVRGVRTPRLGVWETHLSDHMLDSDNLLELGYITQS